MTNKLYRVNLRGMRYSSGSSAVYGVSYVVAQNAEDAYQKVRKFLDDKDIGFSKDRALESIEFIAEESQYSNTGHILFL